MKVCGITSVEDAQYAESCGAWAIGVILSSDSPRSIPRERARDIFAALSPSTVSVAVTHTTSQNELQEILSLRPTAVQLYHPFTLPVQHQVKVFHVVRRGEPLPSDGDALVIDDSHGSGRQYDPSFAREVMRRSPLPVILAGGLTPGNVREAIDLLHPYAVDVSSGVERSPGVKDREKVKVFLTLCQEVVS